MSHVASIRPELFNQIEVGRILKLSRKTIGEIAPVVGCSWKRDPSRPGIPRYLDRADIRHMARRLGITPDWSALAG